MELLIRAGAELDAVEARDGLMPLHIALALNRYEAAEKLLDHGANPDALTRRGFSPAHVAVVSGSTGMIDLLRRYDPDWNAVDRELDTPVHLAATLGHLEIMAQLLDVYDGELDRTNRFGTTALHKAVMFGQAEMVAFLAQRGANLEAKNYRGNTPLHLAVQMGLIEPAAALLDHRADLHARDRIDNTPFLRAALYRQHDMVAWLLKQGANLNDQGFNQQTALHIAATTNNVELARMLLDHGINVNTMSQSGRSPLNVAMIRGHMEVARLLIDHGADIHESFRGWTTLNDCAWRGQVEAVKLLLELGADTEIPGGGNQTPLIIAARKNHPEVVALLLDHQANPWAETFCGLTAWHVAYQIGHTNVTRILESRVADMPPTTLRLARVYFEYVDPYATNVFLSGYFNDYSETADPMTREPDGVWYLERPIFDTCHTYKFIVDGQWVFDPRNNERHIDLSGNTSFMWASNNYVSLRSLRPRPQADDQIVARFEFEHREARTVFVSGEFNGWSTTSLPMTRDSEGRWSAELRMRPGEYGYKLIVDGVWILDPGHDRVKDVNGVVNSLVVVERNH